MAKRILIADDSLTIQKAFAMTFGAEDLTLTTARSADEGLSMVRQTRPDLVIADAAMPGRSGYELCAAIKGDSGLRGTPVYILASSQQPYDEARGRDVGADGHLIKPWDSNALLDRIREAMGRGPSTTTASAAPAAAAAPAARPSAPAPSSSPFGSAGRLTGPSIPVAALDDAVDVEMDAPRDTSREMPRQTGSSMPVVPAAAPIAHAPSPAHAPAPPPAPAPRPATLGLPGPQHAPAPPSAGSQSHGSSPALRPSLIPGVRPGVVPPARPGTVPVRPTAAGPAPAAAVPPRPATTPAVGRTLVGLPAANLPIPGSTRPAPGGAASPALPSSLTSPLARQPTGPVAPLAPRAPTGPFSPLGGSTASAHAPAVAAAVSSAVDQKVAAIAARGPEYEALAKLSREVIEQIVWEIVPELAEAIIREHVEKRGRV